MSETQTLAALDLGATTVRCMVAQSYDTDTIHCIGYGEAQTDGMRRGVIVNIEKITRCISRAVEDAERMAGTPINSLLVGVAGDYVRSINSQGIVGVARSDQEITMVDVRKALSAARNVRIPHDQEILYVIQQNFTVDGQGGVRNPIGMSGSRLEVDAHIVTCAATSARNILRTLERCDLALGGIALETIAAARCVITEAEEELGVAVVNLGAESTDLAVYFDGAVRYTGTIPLGGHNVTNDIAIGLRTTVEEAEKLKVSHGVAMTALTYSHDTIPTLAADGRLNSEVSHSALATIIEARQEEIFTMVAQELRRCDMLSDLTAGVTLTGSGAKLRGIVDLAERTLKLPVKIGRPHGIENLPSALAGPTGATIAGLALWGFEQDLAGRRHSGGMRGLMHKVENWIAGHL